MSDVPVSLLPQVRPHPPGAKKTASTGSGRKPFRLEDVGRLAFAHPGGSFFDSGAASCDLTLGRSGVYRQPSRDSSYLATTKIQRGNAQTQLLCTGSNAGRSLRRGLPLLECRTRRSVDSRGRSAGKSAFRGRAPASKEWSRADRERGRGPRRRPSRTRRWSHGRCRRPTGTCR